MLGVRRGSNAEADGGMTELIRHPLWKTKFADATTVERQSTLLIGVMGVCAARSATSVVAKGKTPGIAAANARGPTIATNVSLEFMSRPGRGNRCQRSQHS